MRRTVRGLHRAACVVRWTMALTARYAEVLATVDARDSVRDAAAAARVALQESTR